MKLLWSKVSINTRLKLSKFLTYNKLMSLFFVVFFLCCFLRFYFLVEKLQMKGNACKQLVWNKEDSFFLIGKCDHLLQRNCTINFNNFHMSAADANKLKLLGLFLCYCTMEFFKSSRVYISSCLALKFHPVMVEIQGRNYMFTGDANMMSTFRAFWVRQKWDVFGRNGVGG